MTEHTNSFRFAIVIRYLRFAQLNSRKVHRVPDVAVIEEARNWLVPSPHGSSASAVLSPMCGRQCVSPTQ